jgi:hypothetical protein
MFAILNLEKMNQPKVTTCPIKQRTLTAVHIIFPMSE